MQRQRNGLVPIGDALSDLGGTVQALRETPPPARHHFTQADQVNQLVSASEADPDRGFMARMMALCSLPRTRRLILIGSYMEHVTQTDPESKDRLMKGLDGFLERDRDR